jgi:hypothetical protein
MMCVRTFRLIHPWVCLLLILLTLVSGCSNSYGPVTQAKKRSEIKEIHSEFSSMASSADLPMQYVNEGKIGVSRVEAVLEAADAGDMQARAALDKQRAATSAHRKEIEARVSKALSEAEALRKKYNREFTKAMAQVSAREAELNALIEQKDAVLSSLSREGESRYNEIVSPAKEQFDLETAHIAQAQEIRAALETESNAKILEMTEAAKSTRERAAATVAELNTRAQSIRQQTAARVDELNEQIKSLNTQAQSEINLLLSTRETLLKDSQSNVTELRTKAATIQANLADQEYQLKLTQAESLRDQSQAKTQEKSAGAPTRLERALAEIERLRAETTLQHENAAASFESMMAEIQAKLDDELNEVRKIRVSADRAEEVARAEFVKAEAASLAEAARQTALHAEAVAEARKQEIIAQAEAEAQRIRQEVLDEIAAKKAAKKVEIDNFTSPQPPLPDDLHQVPEIPQVQAVAPRIEPEHVAAFRSSLAQVMRSRAQADAHQLVAEATFAEAKTNLEAVKAQADAVAKEQLAIADALEAQARTRFSELEIKTAKEMDMTDSKYRQDIVNAESFKKEKEAEAMDYESQAAALETIANARAQQLQAEADARSRCLQKDIEELQVKLWAIQQRGDAQYAKLIAEAASVADSQEALAMQIDAQIDAARRSLHAELAKIDSSIESSTVIANADYREALAKADALRQKTEAEINRTRAQFAMEESTLKAQIERDRKLALSQSLRGEAICDRMVADANAGRICDIAQIDAQVAAAEADMNIMLADNAAKRDAAKAYLDAVKTRFVARVEQVKAERAINSADARYAVAMERTDLESALAQAVTAREESKRKLAELQKRQAELQTASMANWSAKLAIVKDVDLDFDSLQMTVPADDLRTSPGQDTSGIRMPEPAPITRANRGTI